jgi:hypothetical protein
MHPDALTSRRPDAAVFGMGPDSTPPEMAHVFNLSAARQVGLFVGALETPTITPVRPKKKLKTLKKGLRRWGGRVVERRREERQRDAHRDLV